MFVVSYGLTLAYFATYAGCGSEGLYGTALLQVSQHLANLRCSSGSAVTTRLSLSQGQMWPRCGPNIHLGVRFKFRP